MGYDIGWIIPRLRSPGRLWSCASSITVAVVGLFSKIIIEFLNKTTVYNKEVLTRAAHRPPGVPLITVSNHHSCFDDPGLWGVLDAGTLVRRSRMRWSLAAHDICFTNAVHSCFFALGKCVPVVRGAGVYQIQVGRRAHGERADRAGARAVGAARVARGHGLRAAQPGAVPAAVPQAGVPARRGADTAAPARRQVAQIERVRGGDASRHHGARARRADAAARAHPPPAARRARGPRRRAAGRTLHPRPRRTHCAHAHARSRAARQRQTTGHRCGRVSCKHHHVCAMRPFRIREISVRSSSTIVEFGYSAERRG